NGGAPTVRGGGEHCDGAAAVHLYRQRAGSGEGPAVRMITDFLADWGPGPTLQAVDELQRRMCGTEGFQLQGDRIGSQVGQESRAVRTIQAFQKRSAP